MRRLFSLSLSFALGCSGLVALSAAPARAQGVASASIERLREQYEQLLAVDRDPATPPEVRQLNHTFLEERRALLREALKARIEAVRRYRSFAAATLTEAERGVLEQSVRDLERQLRALGSAPRKEPPAAAAAQPPAAAQPAARRAARGTKNTRAAAVEAAAVRSEPEPTPEPEPDGESGQDGGGDEDAPKPAATPRPIVVTSPAEGEDPAKGITVATREVELKLEVDKTIDELQVTVFSGEGKNQKSKALPVRKMKPSAQGKTSFVVPLAKGKNIISVDDVDRRSDPAVEAKRIITYTPPEDEDGGGGADSASGGGPTSKLSAPTTDKWTNVPEEGQHVRVGYVGASGKSYQFYLKKKDGSPAQNIDSTIRPGVSGVVSAVFPDLDTGDRVGIVELKEDNTPDDTKRDEIAVESTYDETKGGPFGLLVGGVVLSQQAQEFQQSDPFFGFTVGYMSKLRNAYTTAKGKCGNERFVDDFFRQRRVYVAEDGKLVDDAGQEVDCGADKKFFYVKNADGKRVISQVKRLRNSGFNGWRWNLRFQGIFQADPRTATATDTATTDGGGTGGGTNGDPFTFIASRKTFDINAQVWWDFWANSAFSIGPYASVGASTVLDKNELDGEAVADGEASDTEEGEEGEGASDTVATQSQSANDMKKYVEAGALMNVMLNRDLFAQAILAYRRDEALAGLYASKKDCFTCDTRNRFAGKLRVFPFGLNRGFGRQIKMAPMFGVELNAGRGPDHVKFFSGFAVRIRGINISDAGSAVLADTPPEPQPAATPTPTPTTGGTTPAGGDKP